MSDVNNTKKDGVCRVIVHNANNVPSTERFRGLPDPYINVFYHGSYTRLFPSIQMRNIITVRELIVFICLGIKKQTSWQRSTCDPKWEEVD